MPCVISARVSLKSWKESAICQTYGNELDMSNNVNVLKCRSRGTYLLGEKYGKIIAREWKIIVKSLLQSGSSETFGK